MRFVKPDVGTVCVGSAYGEAAMLLAAGVKVRIKSGGDKDDARTILGQVDGC
jgi:ATP-dependent protease ClpP protease subunit